MMLSHLRAIAIDFSSVVDRSEQHLDDLTAVDPGHRDLPLVRDVVANVPHHLDLRLLLVRVPPTAGHLDGPDWTAIHAEDPCGVRCQIDLLQSIGGITIACPRIPGSSRHCAHSSPNRRTDDCQEPRPEPQWMEIKPKH